MDGKEAKLALPGAQRLRISLRTQGTQVQSMVREDSTNRAIKPSRCNYRACALQLLKPIHPRTSVPQEQPLQ